MKRSFLVALSLLVLSLTGNVFVLPHLLGRQSTGVNHAGYSSPSSTSPLDPNGTRVTAPIIINTALAAGAMVNLTIRVENVGPLPQDLDGWQVRLQLNASLLQITRIIEGPVLADIASALGGVTLFGKQINNTAGTAFANDLLILGTPQPSDEGFTGSGDLVYIEVRVLTSGRTDLSFFNTLLRDIDGTTVSSIDHTDVNGVFSNILFDVPPAASFTFVPDGPVAGSPVAFDASASTDPDGTIVKYTWNFGDNTPTVNVTSPFIRHTYNMEGGPFTVNLKVTDNGGKTDSTSKSLFVQRADLPPVAIFTFTPGNPMVGQPVTFDASASFDPDGSLCVPPCQAWLWDFGDGSTFGGRVVTHTYFIRGTFNVTLTVTDDRPLRSSTTRPIMVGQSPPDIPPVANFTLSTATPVVGDPVFFDGSRSFDPDGTIQGWAWNFGDGSLFLDGPFAAHSYSTLGSFTVTLTVGDNSGSRGSQTALVHVRARPTHDVSIDRVDAFPRVAVSSQFVDIRVLIRNSGMSNETVSLTAFYDSHVIATLTRIQLGPGPYFEGVNVLWDTSGVAAGNYTISATVFLATDENPSDNSFIDGPVKILPPPTLTITPSVGQLGAKITVQGSGFPPPLYGPISIVLVSFDDMFLGFGQVRNGNFTFTFDVPHAEPGPHQVKAFDEFTGVRASVPFQVEPSPAAGNLSVTVDCAAVYFPGDRADIYALVTQNGVPAAATKLQLTLIRPDGSSVSLNSTSISPGLYRSSYSIPRIGSAGTYAVVARVQLGSSESSALRSFEVKPSWLAAQGPRLASATVAVVGIAAVAIAWRKGYLRRKGEDIPPSF